MFATSTQRWLYQHAAKPLFFKHDPEVVHDRIIDLGKTLGSLQATQLVAHGLYSYEHPALNQQILGIRFPNPVGLTAGFDKNAELTRIIPRVGFGFHEIGSVTGKKCAGNKKPRLWRLKKSGGLVVYYGLKNDGCDVIAERLQKKPFYIPIGTNIAKTNSSETVELQAGIDDYVASFKALAHIGHYFTVNISCPNAFGGEPFADPERLDALLTALDPIPTKKPILVKLSADHALDNLPAILEVTDRHRVHGFILSNLSKKRDLPGVTQDEKDGINQGGISGRPIYDLSNELLSNMYQLAGDRYVLIGTGGIFTAEHAYEKILRGASLVQLATGMIFEGPQVIGEINKGLVRLLQQDGFNNISEAVGFTHK